MRMPQSFFTALILLAAGLGTAGAEEPKSRWEAGIALGAYSYTDWRGADHRNTTFLPLPYLIYRGERVHLARDGLKIRLLDSDRLSINLAAAFSLAGRAADNPLRAGMPKLLGTFKVGPVVNVNINSSPKPLIKWDLRLPVLAVAATNFRQFRHAGFTAFPHLRGRYETEQNGWTYLLGSSLGAELASEQNNDYFYQVRASEARSTRPAYDAKAGYGGAALSSYASASRGRWGYGVYARFDDLHGATFENSPLVQTKDFWSAGFGVSYRFFQSDAKVIDDDTE